MLVRIGSCQVCEATFSLAANFEAPWVSCRICSGPVQVGPPEESEAAIKRASRRGGTGKGEAAPRGAAAGRKAAGAKGEASVAGSAVVAAASTAVASASAAAVAASTSAPSSEPKAPVSPAPVKASTATPTAAQAPAGSSNSRPAPTAPPAAPPPPPAKWSPAALEAEVRAKAQPQPAAPAQPAKAPASPARAAELAPRPKAPAKHQEAELEALPLEELDLDDMPLDELELAPPPPKLSTLERLKAERAAAASAPAPKADPKPQASQGAGRPSTLERLKAERAQAAAAPTGHRPSPAPASQPKSAASAPASKQPAASARASREEQPEKASGGKGGSKRRPREVAAKQNQGPPVAGLLGLGGLVVLGAIGYLGFREGGFLSKAPPAPETDPKDALSQAPTSTPGETPAADPFATLPGTPAPAAAGLAPTNTDAPVTAPGQVAPVQAAPAPTAPVATPSAPPEKPKNDPDAIDLAAYGPFPNLPETSSEDQERIDAWVKDLFNPNAGASAGRARTNLINMGKSAIPAVVNALIKIDCGTQDGMLVGADGVQVLEKICNGTNYGWRTSDDPQESEYYNKRAIELWCQAWKLASVDEAKWKKLAKLEDPEGEGAGDAKPEPEASDENSGG